MLLATAAAGWTVAYREHPTIKASQPLYMVTLAAGILVTFSSVLCAALDHRDLRPARPADYGRADVLVRVFQKSVRGSPEGRFPRLRRSHIGRQGLFLVKAVLTLISTATDRGPNYCLIQKY